MTALGGAQGSAGGVRVVTRTILTSTFRRGPGCGSFCSAARGHDTASHEHFGRELVYAEIAARPTGVVQTGPLLLDFDGDRVLVAGQEAPVTPLEQLILFYLGSRLGRRCRHFATVAAVWGVTVADLERARGRARWHLLRMHVARLRRHLGVAGPLIETVPQFGYRLRAIPPLKGEALYDC